MMPGESGKIKTDGRQPHLHCNVPTLGHHHRAEIYDDQSSQMGARASTGVFERHCGLFHRDKWIVGMKWIR